MLTTERALSDDISPLLVNEVFKGDCENRELAIGEAVVSQLILRCKLTDGQNW